MYFRLGLIEEIEKICKQSNDRKAVLTNLANLFKIPIDTTRLDDYQILKIDFEKLSLEVLDTKTSTTFISEYNPYSEVLGWAHPDNEYLLNYINVTSFSPVYETKRVYRADEETPMLERITIRNNEYGLYFERTKHNVIRVYSRQDGTMFLIKYFKEAKNRRNGEKRKFDLLSSIYKSNYTEKKYIDFFTRLFVHSNHETLDNDIPDQFYFSMGKNITVGSRFRSKTYRIDGACFECVDENSLTEATFNPMEQIKDYSNFDISFGGFAVLYAGYSYPNRNTAYYHDLEIIKLNGKLQVKYRIENRLKQKCIFNNEFEISNLSLGNITLPEIDLIIQELQNRFADDDFIKFIISELQRFRTKLAEKNGLSQEIISPLSPKALIDKPLDEIQVLVSENKDTYFKWFSDQFDNAINIAKPIEEGQTRERKPEKPQSSED